MPAAFFIYIFYMCYETNLKMDHLELFNYSELHSVENEGNMYYVLIFRELSSYL